MRQLVGVARATILVERMGSDAVFGDVVHLPRTDLQLDALAPRPNHRRMDGAIIVLLGGGDIIFEPTGHSRPFRMDDAKRPVAILDTINDDAKAEDIGQLLEGE